MTLFDEDCSKYTEFKMTLFIIETTSTNIISLLLFLIIEFVKAKSQELLLFASVWFNKNNKKKKN